MKIQKILKRFIFFDGNGRVIERAIAYRVPTGRFMIARESVWPHDGLGDPPKWFHAEPEAIMKKELNRRFNAKIGGHDGVRSLYIHHLQLADLDPKFGWSRLAPIKPLSETETEPQVHPRGF